MIVFENADVIFGLFGYWFAQGLACLSLESENGWLLISKYELG